jgi:hypothetical protein
MQSTNFVVLTGHLNDYALSDLISILRHQRKTGRLLVEYEVGPCAFYFAEGDLVDAQLNSMGGLQAIIVALSQPNAAFNFNPLIQPPHRSVSESSQKVIMELLGCWEEKTIELDSSAVASTGEARALPPQSSLELIEADDVALLPQAKETLSLPPARGTERANHRSRQIIFTSALISLIVSLLSFIALSSWFNRKAASASSPDVAVNASATRNPSERVAASAQTVKVIGRVAQAFVAEHRPGLEAYESLALKVARGRRYAPQASGQDTVLVSINSPR